MTVEFDPDAAAARLARAESISNADQRKAEVALVTAAALVDIADSLRTLAVESAIAMGHAGVLGDVIDDEGDSPADGFAPDADLTRADADTRVATTRGAYREGSLTGEQGVDQGVPWVGVVWDDIGAGRVFVTDVAPLRKRDDAEVFPDSTPTIAELAASPVPLVGVATADEAPALHTVDDGDGEPAVGGYELDGPEVEVIEKGAAYPEETVEPADLVDDIDDDFDGDRHPEAVDAVAALKARKKAAKKGKS